MNFTVKYRRFRIKTKNPKNITANTAVFLSVLLRIDANFKRFFALS